MEPTNLPSPDPGAGDGCIFCRFAERFPELAIHESNGWVLAHIHDFLPLGTTLLFPTHHGLLPDVQVEQWHQAAPLMTLTANMLTECAQAERVYMLSFSEFNYHFHIAFVPKTAHLQASRGGAVGVQLIHEVISRTPPPPADIQRVVAKYRAFVSKRQMTISAD